MTLLAAAVPILSSVTSAISGTNPDAERFAKIETWYKTAVAALPRRDTFEECKLKYYSGRFGSHDCGGGIISGWATQAAKDYDYKLYNQFLAVAQGQIPKSTTVPAPTTIPSIYSTAATISEVAGAVSATSGAVAYSGGVDTTASRIANAIDFGKFLLVAGGVLLVGYMILRARR